MRLPFILIFKLSLIFFIKTSAIENSENDLNVASTFTKDDIDLPMQSLRMKRAMSTELKYEWKFPIKFYIADDINTTAVRVGLKRFEKYTCLRFKEECFELGRHQGIRFFRGKGCASSLGKVFENEPQGLSLAYTCDTPGTVQQTMGHALGMLREQRRIDNDKYVRRLLWNINTTYLGKFMKKNASDTYGVPYDIGSGMHSGRYDYSVNKKDTILPLDKSFIKTIGQIEFSFNDYKLLNIYYCNNQCPVKLKCLNYGYTDPNNCNICRCPTFYGGKYCHKRRISDEGCPPAEIQLNQRETSFTIIGKKTCFFYITTDEKKKIRVNLGPSTKMYVNPLSKDWCPVGKGLEIRHITDKGSTGAMFCGKMKGSVTLSEANYTNIKYVGTSDDDRLHLILLREPN
ncbi:Astacin-like metalloendopeptidase [Strongyloides ratti]|uniref:Metalloendopeptidase n=1 Tax=Strongyloides ratti TaxID=34506 RepID=A0A090MZS4_STRRB|nr:Astacin-like metalloendopeptidase [Strongyloides ratti]CEF69439.1 Astacin-like metalloendopeptidase [Strongyloides ratti]